MVVTIILEFGFWIERQIAAAEPRDGRGAYHCTAGLSPHKTNEKKMGTVHNGSN